jgi:hypothetical protein
MGRASRQLAIVAPASDPIPFPGGVPVVELDLYDRSSRAYLLEPAKEAGLAIII